MQALQKYIPHFYFLSVAIVICGLSTSMFLMSVGSLLLSATWILEGNFKNKLKNVKFNKTLLLLLAVYLIHIIGLLYSDNSAYALKDLRIKLPLFIFPLILATSGYSFGKKNIDYLLMMFIGSVLISTFYSFLIYKNIITIERDVSNPRSISQWISHIRLSLNICMSVFILFFYFTNEIKFLSVVRIIVSIWFLYFLYLIESATGYSILLAGFLVVCGYYSVNAARQLIRTSSLIILIMTLLSVGVFIYLIISSYYQPRDLDIHHLEKTTKYGEPYEHDTTNLQLENGYYIWLYVAQNEMRKTWDSKSDFKYDGVDKKGQPLKYTLIRYLTSKGLRKDRDGVNSLGPEDIDNIENGTASVVQLESFGINRRIRIILYELDSYFRGLTPNGNSVTQRFEYWRIGWNLFKSSPVIGVGTGDIDDDYKLQYRIDKSKLLFKFRHRAHNQFLTILITFGVIGFLLFMLSLLWPLFQYKGDVKLLYLLFFMVIIISFIGEDTLETQAGVTFYAVFNSLLLFQVFRRNNQSKSL